MSILKNKKIITTVKYAVPCMILVLIFFEAKSFFTHFNWALLEHYLDRLSIMSVIFIFILGLVALVPMFFYDVILNRLLKIRIPAKKLIGYSLSANAYSNLIGFGGVAGATLRTIYYRPYVSSEIPYIKIIAKLSLFYLSGLSVLAWFVLFSNNQLFSELRLVHVAVWGIALYAPILLIVFLLKRKLWDLSNVKREFISELMMISVFEWLFVVICIWGITNIMGESISLLAAFPIVILAACAGIASMLPGGIGSFDLVLLLGFEAQGIPGELGLLVLMFYRGSYYIVPALLGTPIAINVLWGKLKPNRF
ncbi:lysylphosphatidylglycerol synthase domain-containing protein [Cytobacillus purgationiresistens]|uniref:Phosphatidylglycerol lysyltransferase n=1 Tax=Cytobacillus purgationiresistens TaxID=863449 RepID=A0ABU0AD99_9BACI|nr:lysylphosphatidylglycerol synthase domain-containing protein [Cytobacillus purgationiresistens]MDQ0268413.1 phosphatidylglycerol lysyltransferase [Cytobacillus purgationiresistens]